MEHLACDHKNAGFFVSMKRASSASRMMPPAVEMARAMSAVAVNWQGRLLSRAANVAR